jgi:hypothetical protein
MIKTLRKRIIATAIAAVMTVSSFAIVPTSVLADEYLPLAPEVSTNVLQTNYDGYEDVNEDIFGDINYDMPEDSTMPTTPEIPSEPTDVEEVYNDEPIEEKAPEITYDDEDFEEPTEEYVYEEPAGEEEIVELPPTVYYLPTPSLTADGSIVSWNLIERARNYMIYVDGQPASWWLPAHTSSFNLHQLNLGYGTYEIQVRARGHFGIVVVDSELSNSVTVTLAPNVLAPGQMANVNFVYETTHIEITTRAGGFTQLRPVTVSQIELFEDTGLTVFTPVRIQWFRATEAGYVPVGNATTTNFDMMSINPDDIFSLTSRANWSLVPQLGVNNQAGIEVFVLKVHFFDILAARSELIEVVITIEVPPAATPRPTPTPPVAPPADIAPPVIEEADPAELNIIYNTPLQTELNFVEGDPLNISPIMFNMVLELDPELNLTSNSPIRDYRVYWYRDGEFLRNATTLTGRLSGLGINPEANRLVSRNIAPALSLGRANLDHSGVYTLRAYTGGERALVDGRIIHIDPIFLGESSPVTINVVSPNTDLISVDFNYYFTRITAAEGEHVTINFNPLSLQVNLASTTQELSPSTPVHWRWVRTCDGLVRSSANITLDCLRINPANPNMLTSRIVVPNWFNANRLWPVSLSDAGVYRLHVFIAGEEVAVSDTFTVNVYPDPAFNHLTVTLNHHYSRVVLPAWQNVGEFYPITATFDLVRVLPNSRFTADTSIRLEWWINGEASLVENTTFGEIGINPRVGSQLSADITPNHVLSQNMASPIFAGTHVLRVYIADRLVIESNPVIVEVVDGSNGQNSNFGIVFEYIQRHLFAVDGEDATFAPPVGFRIISSETNDDMFTISAAWYRDGQSVTGPLWFVESTNLNELGSTLLLPNFMEFLPASLQDAGSYTLRVSINGEFVAESEPVWLEVAICDNQIEQPSEPSALLPGAIIFSYPPGNNGFPLTVYPQLGNTHHYGVEFEVIIPEFDFVMFQWIRNGEAFGDLIDSRTLQSPARRVTVTLPEVNPEDHSGVWYLVAYTYVDGQRRFMDVSRTSLLTVRSGNEHLPVATPQPTAPPTTSPTIPTPNSRIPAWVFGEQFTMGEIIHFDGQCWIILQSFTYWGDTNWRPRLAHSLFGLYSGCRCGIIVNPTPQPTPTPPSEPEVPTPIPTPQPTPSTPSENGREVRDQLREPGDIVTISLQEGVESVTLFGSALNMMIADDRDFVIESATGATITIPTGLMQEMIQRAYPFASTGTFVISLRDLEVELDPDNLVLASLALDISVNNAQIAQFNESIVIERYIREDIRNNPYLNTNYNRITVRDAYGNHLGGVYSPETGLFRFETYEAGEFEIVYVMDLRRLVMSLDSSDIADLAQPHLDIASMDILPMIQNNRTLVPVRFIAYALGFDVDWNDETREVTLEFDGQSLTFAIGDILEGMDIPAQIVGHRTMVPLRFIAEHFGATVNFDDVTREIEIIR